MTKEEFIAKRLNDTQATLERTRTYLPELKNHPIKLSMTKKFIKLAEDKIARYHLGILDESETYALEIENDYQAQKDLKLFLAHNC